VNAARSRTLLAATSALLVLPLAGCSLIGYTIGSEMESNPRRMRPATAAEVATTRKGDTVILTMKDGTRLLARYDGLYPWPDSAYAARYAAWRAAARLDFRPPRLGEQVHVHGWAWPSEWGPLDARGEFLGFAPGRLHVERRGKALAADLPMLGTLTGEDGRAIRGEQLLAVTDLPLQAVAILTEEGVPRRVDLYGDSLAGAQLGPPRGSARKTGFFAGLVIDVAAVVMIALAN